MQKILVTGAKGQLGSEIRAISEDYPQFQFVFVDRDDMPLEKTDALQEVLDTIQPDTIVHAGAYTAVDKAEEEKEVAEAINHFAVSEIATWTAHHQARLIYISTDYVFDGTSKTPLREQKQTAPINWYGATKLKGEQALQRVLPEGIIIRTAWVYSEFGNNFVKTMLRLMKDKPSLNVVNDQIGSPTHAADLAKAIMNIITAEQWEAGIFHYSNQGQASWFEFAKAIQEIAGLDCEVHGVTSDQFPTLAKRPKYSLLDKTKIQDTFQISIPPWRDSLKRMLTKVKAF